MKYLSLILVCYAVKCENVGNNYFVVKMPGDDLQHDIKDFKKPFQVYWNVPTMQCASKKIPFRNLYEKFGIIQNDDDKFIGNKVVIIYDEKDFPAIKKNKTGTNILRNGGVPQDGNLENHLLAFENDLNKKIPDPYFDGIAIIDFESWRPVFLQNFGALAPHRYLSIEIEKNLHNWWPKMWIEREASLRFEAAARRFMQTTLSVAKEKRPNAYWGYYGFPYCFNMRGRDMAEKCANNTDKENDSIYWLWAESTALFPSLYSSVSLTSSQLSSLIKGRIKEASRVRGRDIPIFPYFWYRYRDAGLMTEKDLDVALTTLYQSNASGFILWGSSNDVNTVDKCNKLYKYVETVLGPKIAKYTKQIKRNNDNLENKVIYSKEPSTVYDGFSNTPSTQSLNTDTMFSTETSTETEESSQTLNNDDMSSTKSTIKYNDYTNNDLQTINNLDLTSSLLGSSTNSEDMPINLSDHTHNNDIFTTESIAYDKYTYIDDNSQSLNNDDLILFSLASTAYSEYTNTNQSPQTPNNGKISLEKMSTENFFDTKNNNNVIFSSESSTFDYENSDYSTLSSYNDDNSLAKMSTFDNSDKEKSSQTLNYDISNEENTIVYNEYDTEENVRTLNNDIRISSSESSTFGYENSTHSTLSSYNNDNNLAKISTFDNSDKEKSSQTLNYDISNEESTIIYNEYDTEENMQTLNNDDIKSSSESSTFDYENRNHSTTTLNNDEMPLTKLLTIHNSNRDESSQTLNYNMSDNENNINNEYSEAKANVSSESSIIYENSDHSTKTLNNNEMSTTDTLILYSKFINTDQTKIILNNKKTLSKGTSTINDDFVSEDLSTDSLNNVKYMKETSTASYEINYSDKSRNINYDEVITENNEFRSTGNVINNNTLLNSSEDQYDYLIKVDNSKNIETFQQSEYKDSKNIDEDYLIIVRNFENKQNLKENITDSKLENVYDTTQADNNVTVTKDENIKKTTNDLIVTFIDKKHEFKTNEVSTSTEVESFHNIGLLNSDDDRSDYLIKVDNSTNLETYNQSENTNITNADNDYLVIVTDFNNNKYDIDNILDNNLNLDIYTQTESDTNFEDLDPVVAYINKTIDNMKLQEKISAEDESLNNIKLPNPEEDTFDYLIKLENFTNNETAKEYEHTESTIDDKDYIIIIKNIDD